MFTIALIISAIEFFISGDLLWGFGCLIAVGVLWGIIFLIDALIEKHKRKERELQESIEHKDESLAALEREEEEEQQRLLEQHRQLFLQAKLAQIQSDINLRDKMFSKCPGVFKMIYELDPETIKTAELIIAEECQPISQKNS